MYPTQFTVCRSSTGFADLDIIDTGGDSHYCDEPLGPFRVRNSRVMFQKDGIKK